MDRRDFVIGSVVRFFAALLGVCFLLVAATEARQSGRDFIFLHKDTSSCTKTPGLARRVKHEGVASTSCDLMEPTGSPTKLTKPRSGGSPPLTPSGALGRLRRNAARSGMPARRERGLMRNRTVDHPREVSPSTSLELAAVGALARLVRSCLYRRI